MTLDDFIDRESIPDKPEELDILHDPLFPIPETNPPAHDLSEQINRTLQKRKKREESIPLIVTHLPYTDVKNMYKPTHGNTNPSASLWYKSDICHKSHNLPLDNCDFVIYLPGSADVEADLRIVMAHMTGLKTETPNMPAQNLNLTSKFDIMPGLNNAAELTNVPTDKYDVLYGIYQVCQCNGWIRHTSLDCGNGLDPITGKPRQHLTYNKYTGQILGGARVDKVLVTADGATRIAYIMSTVDKLKEFIYMSNHPLQTSPP